jgi:hypothetical protein
LPWRRRVSPQSSSAGRFSIYLETISPQMISPQMTYPRTKRRKASCRPCRVEPLSPQRTGPASPRAFRPLAISHSFSEAAQRRPLCHGEATGVLHRPARWRLLPVSAVARPEGDPRPIAGPCRSRPAAGEGQARPAVSTRLVRSTRPVVAARLVLSGRPAVSLRPVMASWRRARPAGRCSSGGAAPPWPAGVGEWAPVVESEAEEATAPVSPLASAAAAWVADRARGFSPWPTSHADRPVEALDQRRASRQPSSGHRKEFNRKSQNNCHNTGG